MRRTLTSMMPNSCSITLEDVERAKEILIETKKLSARDALHLAVMERESIEQIMSFDRGFDDIPGRDPA